MPLILNFCISLRKASNPGSNPEMVGRPLFSPGPTPAAENCCTSHVFQKPRWHWRFFEVRHRPGISKGVKNLQKSPRNLQPRVSLSGKSMGANHRWELYKMDYIYIYKSSKWWRQCRNGINYEFLWCYIIHGNSDSKTRREPESADHCKLTFVWSCKTG